MMFIASLILLALLTALTYAWLSRNLGKAYRKKLRRRDELSDAHARLVARSLEVEGEQRMLQAAFDETIALYDITNEITKHLDEQQVFASFIEQLRKYIDFSDCRFLRELPAEEGAFGSILPLKMAGKVFGYLAAAGVAERDTEKFQILGGQFILGIKRAILYQRVQEMATFDGLTHVFTRRYWFERSNQEMERSRRFGYTAGCLMVDIDHFKAINDRYGHLVGDAILVEVARIIKESIRQIDLFGKYGGEEFCLLLTETDKDNSVFVAERIRQAIAQKPIRAYDEDLSVTVSVGVAMFTGGGAGLTELIDASDKALYAAKEGGRNRVCTFGG